MRKHLITTIVCALLTLLAAGHAQAANEPLVLGLHAKSAAVEMGALVTKSLARDPTGRALLQPELCKTRGACATPLIYCHEIGRRHRESNLSTDDAACLKQLARYLGGLVCRPAPSGEWYLDRLTSDGVPAKTDHARPAHRGEYECSDTSTGVGIFWSDCGNVRGKEKSAPVVVRQALAAPPSCAESRFDAKPGDQVRFAEITNGALPAECGPALWDGQSWEALDSPCDSCDWLGPLSAVPADYQPRYTFRFTVQGPADPKTGLVHVRIRLNPAVRAQFLATCITRGNIQSDADVVTPEDWQDKDVHNAPASWPLFGTTGGGNYRLPGK